MLTVTNDAASAMRNALERAAIPDTTGMRISADPNADQNGSAHPALRLDVATETVDGDKVVEAPGGLHVFIEPEVAPLLEDKVLDGMVEPNGRAAFRIVTQKQ
jgi:Fe-S cluster assembly iron-binding protein IscA